MKKLLVMSLILLCSIAGSAQIFMTSKVCVIKNYVTSDAPGKCTSYAFPVTLRDDTLKILGDTVAKYIIDPDVLMKRFDDSSGTTHTFHGATDRNQKDCMVDIITDSKNNIICFIVMLDLDAVLYKVDGLSQG